MLSSNPEPEALRARVARRLSRHIRAKYEGVDRDGVEQLAAQLSDETIAALAGRLFSEPVMLTSVDARYLLRQGATETELREFVEFSDTVAGYWNVEPKWDLIRGLHHYDLPELARVNDFSTASDETKELCRWLLRGPSTVGKALVNPVSRGALVRVEDGRSEEGALVVADLELLRLLHDYPDRTEEIEIQIERHGLGGIHLLRGRFENAHASVGDGGSETVNIVDIIWHPPIL